MYSGKKKTVPSPFSGLICELWLGSFGFLVKVQEIQFQVLLISGSNENCGFICSVVVYSRKKTIPGFSVVDVTGNE